MYVCDSYVSYGYSSFSALIQLSESTLSFAFLLSPLIHLLPSGQNHNPMNGCMTTHTHTHTHTLTQTEKCEEAAAEVDQQKG